MRMKKMLAVLAAISMLASMGISAAAEDETAVTTTVITAEEAVTTAATEATTLTETETTTTAETTTDSETETTVAETTAATEENVAVSRIVDTAEFTLNGIKFQAVRIDPQDLGSHDPLNQSGCVGLTINRIQEDGSIVETNLSKIELYILGDYGNSEEGQMKVSSVSNFFSIDGDVLTIDAYRGNVSYQYVNGQFVKAGEVVTTTTTTTSTTTTTTTVTSGETVTEEMLYQIFEEYVAKKQAQEEHAGNIDSYYYDAETQTAYGVYGRNGSMYYDRLCVITKDGVVEQDLGEMNYEEDAWDIKEAAYFTCNDSRFVVAVVDLYSNGGCLYAINVYNVSSGTPVKTNLYRILIGNVIEPHGYPVTDPNSSIELDDYFATWADDTITLSGVDYTYDTTNEKFVEVGNSGKTDDGKTDSGSTSNKPSTNNTTGTPKTGDVATLPAVALSLTMTAAGVAAIIYKKRK